MLTLTFTGSIPTLLPGITELQKDFAFSIAPDGLPVSVTQSAGDLSVTLTAGKAEITYEKPIHFFRALGHLIEHLRASEEDFSLTETPRFEMNGPMIDVSQGCSVLTVVQVKFFLRRMAVMGLPTLMLYCEDSYDVEHQPYFGYMRSRYSEADMRELDDYADALGIEMIPCIQTLSHLADALRWGVYTGIKEQPHCLLVGEDATYAFLRDLITSASRPFRTKRIHIGMDEAGGLGRGKYLDKHGPTPVAEIMVEHLDRVLAITRELGLKPMMWSDMFFSAGLTGYYADSKDIHFSEEFKAKMPKDVQLVYWHYGSIGEKIYDQMIEKHRELGEPLFAGAIWNWLGFGLHYKKGIRCTDSALASCKKNGIKEVFATIWGDFGTECSLLGVMLGLTHFAEHGYRDTVDEETLRRRFAFTCDGDFDEFMLLQELDEIPGVGEIDDANCAKQLMWQDVLCGLLDHNYAGRPLNDHYARLAQKFAAAAERGGLYAGMFTYYYHVCHTLALKAEMGIHLRSAYLAGDRAALTRMATEVLPELARRVETLRRAHRVHWIEIYKSLGWEIFDMRYGALAARIATAIDTVTDYLDGKTDTIQELDEPRLPFNGKEGVGYNSRYVCLASSARTPFGV